MSRTEMLPEEEEDMLPADEAAEEISLDADQPMDSDPEGTEDQEIQLQNDSIAHFDHHTDSIYCVAAHPLDRQHVRRATCPADRVGAVDRNLGRKDPADPVRGRR